MSKQIHSFVRKAPRRAAAWTQLLVMLAGATVLALVLYPMLHSAGSMSEGSIKWQKGFADALGQSRTSGKPLLVDFSASWCPPCQRMKSDVWPDASVSRAVAAGFIPVFLDVDDQNGQEAGRKYHVESIPTVMVLDANGAVLRRAEPGYMSREELLHFLAQAGGDAATPGTAK